MFLGIFPGYRFRICFLARSFIPKRSLISDFLILGLCMVIGEGGNFVNLTAKFL